MDPRVEQKDQHGHGPCWEGCRGGFLGHQHVTTYLLGEDSQIVLCEVSPVSKVLRLVKLWVRLSA